MLIMKGLWLSRSDCAGRYLTLWGIRVCKLRHIRYVVRRQSCLEGTCNAGCTALRYILCVPCCNRRCFLHKLTCNCRLPPWAVISLYPYSCLGLSCVCIREVADAISTTMPYAWCMLARVCCRSPGIACIAGEAAQTGG